MVVWNTLGIIETFGDRLRQAAKFIFQLAFFLLLVSTAACSQGANAAGVSTTETSSQRNQTIQNKGSDTLVNIALAWAEAYREVEPAVSIAVTGGGTGTGIASLINGTVDIANASRAMKEEEIAEAQAQGFEPVEQVVAIDALAVILHPANPVDALTIQQLSDIYTGKITNWQEVGGRDAPIVLLSRETNSGTHVYFLEEVVRQGDSDSTAIFAPQTLLMPSSVGITSELRRNPNAIGYDGLGYIDPAHERVVAIASDAESEFVLPTVATAASGAYPLSRNLFMYTAGEPTDEIVAYLAWIRSPAGQQIVANLGFVPLPEER
jgi:phosphate transport system substrate-binding protein